jgi:hypothetical protein
MASRFAVFSTVRSSALALLASVGVCTATRAAHANPRPLPFSYPYETLPEGQAEIEQYVDATPLRIVNPENPARRVWDTGYQLQTEFEYGISDRLELGLYLVYAADPGGPLGFDGVKQRLRLRLAEQGEWPVDIGLYGEVSEMHDELELEERVIIARRFDKVRVMANLWLEQGFERYKGDPELFVRPTLGVTGELTPNVHLGVEYWMSARLGNDEDSTGADDFNRHTQHYVGPAVSLQFGKLWWTTGAYLRLNDMSRSGELGDRYGHAWVRSVVGLSI